MKVPGGFSALRACLRIRDFRLFVYGNICHGLGIWLLRMSIGWLAWELEKSTVWLGAVALAETAPSLLLSLYAGTIVDRFHFVKIMRTTQGLSTLLAAVLALLTLTGLIDIWILFFLTVFRGSLMAFTRPSRHVLVHHLVGRDLLAPALATGSIIHNGTRFIGPALGGAIIAASSAGWSFAAASVLIGAYTVILLVLNLEIEARKRERRSILAETGDGLAYILRHPGIRLQLVLLVLLGMLARPVVDLLPAYAGAVFSMGAEGLAVLLAAHGIGATVAGVWVASRAAGIEGMSSLSVHSVLFSAAMLVLFAATDIFWIAAAASVLLGAGMLVLSVTSQTLIQSAVDADFRGRVLSVHGLVMVGVPALGAMGLGVLAEFFGLRLPVLIGGAIFAAVWALTLTQRASLKLSLETPPAPELQERTTMPTATAER